MSDSILNTEVTAEPAGNIIGGETTTVETPATPVIDQSSTPDFDSLPKWTAALTPDTRTKYFDALKDIKGPEDVTKMAFDLKGKLDGAIIRPGENASQEDVDAYRTQMGIPLAKSDYKFDVPEGSGMAVMAEPIREMAFNAGLSNDQVGALANVLVEGEKQALAKLDADMEQIRVDSEKSLRTEYGDEYGGKIAKVNALITNYMDDDFRSFLEETKLGNNAEFIRGMVKFTELVSEDKLNEGSNQGKARTADDYYSFPNTEGME